jgi:hypothetical protein
MLAENRTVSLHGRHALLQVPLPITRDKGGEGFAGLSGCTSSPPMTYSARSGVRVDGVNLNHGDCPKPLFGIGPTASGLLNCALLSGVVASTDKQVRSEYQSSPRVSPTWSAFMT